MILGQRYLVIRPIKSGGMGAVYLAQDQHLGGSLCAVKAILEAVKSDPVILRKFENESKLLSQLQHPGIPRVRDYFVEAETAFIVMDYVAGENLEIPDGEPRPVEEVEEVARAVLDILVYLHGLPTPVIHCDIKPANLIREQATGRIKLVDFGLARALDDRKTQTVAGTLGFSAMEQLQGHAEPRSDLYSLGVSLYYLLTGKVPTFLLVPSILESRPELPPALASIIDSATRLEIDQRPASAAEMRKTLVAGPDPTSAPSSQPAPAVVPTPLDLGLASRKLLRPSPQLAQCLVQLCFILLFLRLLGFTQSRWLLWLGAATLLILATGYAGAIFLQRLESGQPVLPRWGNGRLHLRRGVHSLGLAFILLAPVSLFGLLPLAWSLSQITGSLSLTGLWTLLATALGLINLMAFSGLALMAPWAWASLMESGRLASALETMNGLRHRRELLVPMLQFTSWCCFWGLLSRFVFSTQLWTFAALPALVGWLVGADLLGALDRRHRLTPARPVLQPAGSALSLYLLLSAGATAILLVACYIPSRDPHRYPALGPDVGIGLVNGNGWLSLTPRFEAFRPFNEGQTATPAQQSGRWGYVQRDGRWEIAPRFQEAFSFPEQGPARIKENDRYGYLNRQGQLVVGASYLEARDFHEGLAAVRNEQGWGFIDTLGKWTIPPRFQSEPGSFSQGWARVELHPPESMLLPPPQIFINPQGQALASGSFATAGDFNQGYAPVRVSNGWGWLTLQGKLASGRFEELRSYHEGRAAFRQGEGWGFLDLEGRVAILPMFAEVRDFHQGLAAFRRGPKWGFLDLQGEVWLEPEFVAVSDWNEGTALLQEAHSLTYINPSKRRFWTFFDNNPDHLGAAWRMLHI